MGANNEKGNDKKKFVERSGMDNFLAYSFQNWVFDDMEENRINEIEKPFFDTIDGLLHKYLSEDIADEIREKIDEVYCDYRTGIGVEGMKLAMGVMNGSIKQMVYF